MAKKGSDKKISYLEPSFNDILVCKKNEQRPFLEIFVHSPENVAQEGLGTILGIFEITDDSEDSSYIANYLISVVKKEYFSKSKRGPIESFEAALRKANLALANLAEHETIGWIGNFNAICAVIEKGNIHLSSSGTAKAYLFRGKTLTDISEREDSLSPPNPIKTFEDVLSGRLQENDKIIITTESIFNIFSFEEIKRSAMKFSREEFIRFLKTALINELEKAAVLIVDMQKREEEAIIIPAPKEKEVNAWSQNAFSKRPQKQPRDMPPATIDKSKETVIEKLQEEVKRKDGNYTDKKTGHIYIKEDQFLKEDDPGLPSKYLEISKDKASKLGSSFLFILKSIALKTSLSIKSFFIVSAATIGNATKKLKEKRALRASLKEQEQRERALKETSDIPKPKEEKHPFKNLLLSLNYLKDNLRFKKRERVERAPVSFKESGDKVAAWMKSPSSIASRNVYQKTATIGKSILPNLGRIKELLSRFSYQQKIYAALTVIAIIVIPYFIVKIENGADEKAQPAETETPTLTDPLAEDKNVTRVADVASVYSGSDITKVININGRILIIKKSEIIDAQNNKNFEIPVDFQEPDLISSMDDLNLVLFIKAGKVLSFSPLSGKFQPNSLTIPENSNIVCASTFLTYLYLLDIENSQIYRYPRAEGGFGAKTDWMRETIDMTLASGMAINENIFVLDKENIIKLFQGRKQDFAIEETATPLVLDKIYAQEESTNLYVLDKTNSRIVKLDANGSILNQYSNSEIANALDFTVDEEKNTVYFATGSETKSFEMK